ncbi:alcohol dehydrogenase catalytic domain-containing protein [Streptomyces sp. 769]|uniref:alcohol dehydrogenase catalytic domain-containing protein n=1 Tax=Streptomyces sp. 769 TaxID=1262452 RepID=UPI0005808A18|nr:alcohol dehydrogenase catalytic domain-containing protein [Streptomyces sp. 769]AJC52639.1 alcohol dehydrogenase [Streptomyces sp. 769]AJC61900.1 alcohol dehydrogenase [Streptomyces sp. 769]
MRAAVIEEFNKPLVIRDVPDPECPPDGAILRVGANGICRTDWALWAGNFWTGGPSVEPPFVLGHEFAGTVVVAVGVRMTWPFVAHVSNR